MRPTRLRVGGRLVGRVTSEHDNLRAAIDFTLGADGDAVLAVALSGMSGPVWPELSLQGEGQSRLEAAAARIGPAVPEPDQARVWHWWLSWGMASPAKAVEALERAVGYTDA